MRGPGDQSSKCQEQQQAVGKEFRSRKAFVHKALVS